jgi:hypothetical protein
MPVNGGIQIQGCGYRLAALNADGSITAANASGMISDDKPLVKLEAKPVMENGVEITPVSACGLPVISYKDFDRYKRWDITLTLGDWDPEQMELMSSGQGSLITSTGSVGRTITDGVVTDNSNVLTSAGASFTAADVGRSLSGTGISVSPVPYISEYISTTSVRMSLPALATESAESVVLGAQPVGTIGYEFPRLLCPAQPNGISIEIWSKLIVRCTGYPGTTPYPSAGTPSIPGSAYLRTGIFRAYLWQDAFGIENKEETQVWRGWAIENPNFGTGPMLDWTTTAAVGGTPVPTTAWAAQLCDLSLPATLQPGFQTTHA